MENIREKYNRQVPQLFISQLYMITRKSTPYIKDPPYCCHCYIYTSSSLTLTDRDRFSVICHNSRVDVICPDFSHLIV